MENRVDGRHAAHELSDVSLTWRQLTDGLPNIFIFGSLAEIQFRNVRGFGLAYTRPLPDPKDIRFVLACVANKSQRCVVRPLLLNKQYIHIAAFWI